MNSPSNDPIPPDVRTFKCRNVSLGQFTVEEAKRFRVEKISEVADSNLAGRVLPQLKTILETSGFSEDFIRGRFFLGAAEALANAGQRGLIGKPVIVKVYILPRAAEIICILVVLNHFQLAEQNVPTPDKIKPVDANPEATRGRGFDWMTDAGDVCQLEIEPDNRLEITLVWIEPQ